MTRYLCGHPSHGAPGAPGSVDVTPQVRLERQFPPRALVCLAFTDEVLRRVRMLPEDDPVERTRSVLRVLTGDPNPHDGPAVLVADSRVARPPGMYQIDDLRTAEPVVGALLARYVDPAPEAERATDEVVVLGEPSPYETYGTATERVGTATPIEQETRTRPQGRLRFVILGIVVATVGLAVAGWLSGGLSFLIRDAAFWLGLSIVLVAASMVVAGWGLLQPTTVRGNLDDLFDVRAVYQRRLELQWWTTGSAAGLAVIALLVALLAGLITSSVTPPPAPTPRISFSTVVTPTIAHVSFTARNVGRSDH